MAGVATTTMTSERDEAATVVSRAVKAQHYDTAIRRVRLSMPDAQWRALLATATRHYKTGSKLRTHWCSSLVAWLHVLDASPWVIPTPDWEAAVTAAYVAADQREGDDGPPFIDASVGAAALADDKRARVIRLETPGEVAAWLQRIGPCVLTGTWFLSMEEVRRDTEVIERAVQVGGGAYRKAVALVGFRPGAVRMVNNLGPGWGALGRAWMPADTLEAVLHGRHGCAWGVVPVDLTPKRSAK